MKSMFEDLKKWFFSDIYGILLTLLCAVISILPSIVKLVYCLFGYEGIGQGRNYDEGIWLAYSQVLISIIGWGIIVFIYKPEALDEVSDKRSVVDYMEEKCQIKQTAVYDSDVAYNVVRSTIKQFYGAWFAIWLIWILYYGLGIVLSNEEISKNGNMMRYLSQIEYFLDFCSSTAMYCAYIILNDITVDISSRDDKEGRHYSCLFRTITLCVIILFACILLQTLYLLEPGTYGNFNIYTRFILSFFGTISFVMVLGKLNSYHLNIPSWLIMPLYVYAVSQAFSMFVLPVSEKEFILMNDLANAMSSCLLWIAFLGKVVLLIVLSWVLYRKRLIFYIVQSSISITSRKANIQEFNRYMEQ